MIRNGWKSSARLVLKSRAQLGSSASVFRTSWTQFRSVKAFSTVLKPIRVETIEKSNKNNNTVFNVYDKAQINNLSAVTELIKQEPNSMKPLEVSLTSTEQTLTESLESLFKNSSNEELFKCFNDLLTLIEAETANINESAHFCLRNLITYVFSSENHEVQDKFFSVFTEKQLELSGKRKTFHLIEAFMHELSQHSPEKLETFVQTFVSKLEPEFHSENNISVCLKSYWMYGTDNDKQRIQDYILNNDVVLGSLIRRNLVKDLRNEVNNDTKITEFIENNMFTGQELIKYPGTFDCLTDFTPTVSEVLQNRLVSFLFDNFEKVIETERSSEYLKTFISLANEQTQDSVALKLFDSLLANVEAEKTEQIFNDLFFLASKQIGIEVLGKRLIQDSDELPVSNLKRRLIFTTASNGSKELENFLISEFPKYLEAVMQPNLKELPIEEQKKRVYNLYVIEKLLLVRNTRTFLSKDNHHAVIEHVLSNFDQIVKNDCNERRTKEILSLSLKPKLANVLDKERMLKFILDKGLIPTFLNYEGDWTFNFLTAFLIPKESYMLAILRNDFTATKPRKDEEEYFTLVAAVFKEFFKFGDELGQIKFSPSQKKPPVLYRRFKNFLSLAIEYYPVEFIDQLLFSVPKSQMKRRGSLVDLILKEVYKLSSEEKQEKFLETYPKFKPQKVKTFERVD